MSAANPGPAQQHVADAIDQGMSATPIGQQIIATGGGPVRVRFPEGNADAFEFITMSLAVVHDQLLWLAAEIDDLGRRVAALEHD